MILSRKDITRMRGFTLIELLVSMTILMSIFALSFISLGNLIPEANLDSAITILQADLKEQQMKAMMGYETITGGSSDYGIYFEQDKYVLFTGSSYTEGSEENYVITLAEGLEFESASLPFDSVVFVSKTGVVQNYNSDYDQITIRNVLTQQAQTLSVNLLGVVDTL